MCNSIRKSGVQILHNHFVILLTYGVLLILCQTALFHFHTSSGGLLWHFLTLLLDIFKAEIIPQSSCCGLHRSHGCRNVATAGLQSFAQTCQWLQEIPQDKQKLQGAASPQCQKESTCFTRFGSRLDIVSDIAIFVLKRDVKLQLTNRSRLDINCLKRNAYCCIMLQCTIAHATLQAMLMSRSSGCTRLDTSHWGVWSWGVSWKIWGVNTPPMGGVNNSLKCIRSLQ